MENPEKNQTTAQACITEKDLKSKAFHNSEGKHALIQYGFCCLSKNCREHTINTF